MWWRYISYGKPSQNKLGDPGFMRADFVPLSRDESQTNLQSKRTYRRRVRYDLNQNWAIVCTHKTTSTKHQRTPYIWTRYTEPSRRSIFGTRLSWPRYPKLKSAMINRKQHRELPHLQSSPECQKPKIQLGYNHYLQYYDDARVKGMLTKITALATKIRSTKIWCIDSQCTYG